MSDTAKTVSERARRNVFGDRRTNPTLRRKRRPEFETLECRQMLSVPAYPRTPGLTAHLPMSRIAVVAARPRVAPPAVKMQPSSQTVNAGQKATFRAAAVGTPIPKVRWQVSRNNGASWNDIPGATSSALTIKPQASDDRELYRAVFSNSAGTVFTRSATLAVRFAPLIVTQPAASTSALGRAISISASAKGNPPVKVQWQVSTDGGRTFSPIAGATSPVLTFTPAQSDSGRAYRAIFPSEGERGSVDYASKG